MIRIFSLYAVLGALIVVAACGSSRRDPIKEMQMIGGGCFGPTPATVKMVPLECARKGNVNAAALQKCSLGSLGQRCAEYNASKPACIQACVEHVKQTKF